MTIFNTEEDHQRECTTEGEPEPRPTEEAIGKFEALINIGWLERTIQARDRAEAEVNRAWEEVKRVGLDIEDQLRQASEAAYFQGGRKGFSNDL